MVNVDTDMIIPKQFLKTIKRTGLGKNLFYELRYDEKDAPIDSFVLNQDKYKDSQILITGKNFGCGSSREHAPWSILDYGIKCIIASSFADIFYNNCFKNGILPIKLDESEVTKLQKAAENSLSFTIDLENQKISYFDKNINHEVSFELDKAKKTSLLEGLDDIGLTLAKVNHISDFENKQKSRTPWLYSQQIK
jgi:3-isopropylmalate/(R)-2-methylmalate dehydratase small subunit